MFCVFFRDFVRTQLMNFSYQLPRYLRISRGPDSSWYRDVFVDNDMQLEDRLCYEDGFYAKSSDLKKPVPLRCRSSCTTSRWRSCMHNSVRRHVELFWWRHSTAPHVSAQFHYTINYLNQAFFVSPSLLISVYHLGRSHPTLHLHLIFNNATIYFPRILRFVRSNCPIRASATRPAVCPL